MRAAGPDSRHKVASVLLFAEITVFPAFFVNVIAFFDLNARVYYRDKVDIFLLQRSDIILKIRKTPAVHGKVLVILHVVYVKTDDDFTAANNPTIANEIEQINRKFLDADKNYVLIGPGRWGSSDYWLGIPVKWPHISAARVIVESGLKNYHVDPSQGTHFFQNLTSFGVGYFTVNTYTGDGIFQKDILDSMPAVEETQYVRHVRFERPLKIMMDGKKQNGVILLPEA